MNSGRLVSSTGFPSAVGLPHRQPATDWLVDKEDYLQMLSRRGGEGGVQPIPTKGLAQLGIKRVFNGHVHQPRCLERDGIQMGSPGRRKSYRIELFHWLDRFLAG
jgi:hypothetical protein